MVNNAILQNRAKWLEESGTLETMVKAEDQMR